MRQNGFSLIELLSVIIIFGILLSLGVSSYRGWKTRHDMEVEIRQVYSDIMNLRVMAKTKSIRHFMILGATQIRANEDTNVSGTFNTGDSTLCLWSRKTGQGTDSQCTDSGSVSVGTLVYPIIWSGGSALGFDSKGLADSDSTVCIDFSVNEPTNTAYDCVSVSGGIVNIGKLSNQGGACNNANCVAKK